MVIIKKGKLKFNNKENAITKEVPYEYSVMIFFAVCVMTNLLYLVRLQQPTTCVVENMEMKYL
jgi:hypothetical protein